MKKVTITINTENAAFEDDPTFELKRILNALIAKVEYLRPGEALAIRDINGNFVGEMKAK